MATLDSSNRLLDLDIDAKEEKKTPKANPNMVRNISYGLLALVIVCIVIALSVSLSLFLNGDQKGLASQASVRILSNNVAAMEEQLELSAMSSQEFRHDFDTLQVHLRHSSSTALKNILIDQEKNIQRILTILNASMRDLAVDLPEGEDWYNNYGAKLSKVQRLSMQREELLRLLQTGEAKIATK